MKFLITYVNPRQPRRVVDEKQFEHSSAFRPVMELQVGECAPPRYRTAGYKQIKRIA